ncbi:hypothetical protein MCOR27_005643 [Pyricularia oryzae]|uniref:Uncharacterized protein n=5 Tax=Pyricularia TaxID=48558 RepID=A0ABQ8P1M6_PYRGI|nr:uncharacterized protein MGG_08086 [Pyricularia oryzae 70-15]ELQ39571.1 hypothetical protein OOU_Y34scaffold00492g5 [Pyricularia oryzae Y34]KAH8839445.1 hypothetical protein MCOR01_008645 [Pyricularia oryzae]KAI6303956.1 hypothetical protein MCOR33_000939 [Pyricularia grisea]EHA55234.1 hypothetical protein MGG_08086 [Pyricularia oryzae 70-15]KAH9439296.1 hypothetical protein MCOR02_002859 [Pyricularia oryzae]
MKFTAPLFLGLLVSMGAALSDPNSPHDAAAPATAPEVAPEAAPAPEAKPAAPPAKKEKLCSDGKNKCSLEKKGKCRVPGSPINLLIFSWIDFKLEDDKAC